MLYITFTGDTSRVYKRDFNTDNMSARELQQLCAIWQKEDNDGTIYFLRDDERPNLTYIPKEDLKK